MIKKYFPWFLSGVLFVLAPLFLVAQGEGAAPKAGLSMTPNEILALVGGIIIAGFLGDLLFKVAKIPSVVKLMAIGMLLGPIFEVVDGKSMQDVAPFVGKIALLIILFAGGLSLDLQTVVKQLGKAVAMSLLAFGLTFALIMPIGLYILEMGVIQSAILATLLAGTASSIVIPVISKSESNSSIKTLLSIESALSNLFILVIVVIACDLAIAPNLSVLGVLGTFLLKIFVSVMAAVIAGVLWARLIGFLRQDSLSYMLTLGFIFLLNYVVDELKGSGAISILFFAVMLANVQRTAESIAPRLLRSLGLRLDTANYALNEFLKNIAKELSFLAGTFFFVYLGVLVSFDDFTPDMVITLGLMIGAILVGRLLSLYVFKWVSRAVWTTGEFLLILAMMPRGLATAVMAFKPQEAKYLEAIPGTEMFPFYAMIAILGSNLLMTAFVAIAESRIRRENAVGIKVPLEESAELPREAEGIPGGLPVTPPDSEDLQRTPVEMAQNAMSVLEDHGQRVVVEDEQSEAEEEVKPFSERLFQWFNIGKNALVELDKRSIYSLKMGQLFYWMLVMATSVFGTLAVLMGRPELLFAAMLFSPITPLVHTVILAIITGDVFIFLKGNVKLTTTLLTTVFLAFLISWITPLTGLVDLEKENVNPTILDYLLSLVVGIILPILMLRNRKLEIFAITPILALMLFPPIITLGHGISSGEVFDHLIPGLLAFVAHFTALSIGAIATLLLLGMTRHPASEFIQKWKLQEVEHGKLHKVFERMGLQRFLGYTSNVYARVAVLGIIAIAFFVPLQITVNKLENDYEVKQTMDLLAQQYFNVEDRSAVISVKTENRDESLQTNIQVVTSAYFSTKEREDFQTLVENKLGRPFILRLDQIPSENNQSFAPNSSNSNSNFGAWMEAMRTEFLAVESDIEGGSRLDMTVLGYRTEYRKVNNLPLVHVEYLRSPELSPDAAILVLEDIAAALHLPIEQVRLDRIPSYYQADSLVMEYLRPIKPAFLPHHLLEDHEELHAEVFLPNTISPDSLVVWQRRLVLDYPVLGDSSRFEIKIGEEPIFQMHVF